ncbi:hypothetical protein HK102_002503 [Quaeritorhiza haematococci]|nr:hypothetical protein HK102_002503 [Quaeritorhiza haematococci]
MPQDKDVTFDPVESAISQLMENCDVEEHKLEVMARAADPGPVDREASDLLWASFLDLIPSNHAHLLARPKELKAKLELKNIYEGPPDMIIRGLCQLKKALQDRDMH